LKDEAETAAECLQEAESEAKALRIMTQRMVLTQDEMVCLESSSLIILTFKDFWLYGKKNWSSRRK